MRLIDADALKDVLARHLNAPDVQNGHLLRQWMRVVTNSCITLLDKAPTIDAVEVVRCKDCKYSMMWCKQNGKVIGACWIRKMNSEDGQFCLVGQDEFCSYGERREP